jgi:hypothetical protein
MDQLIDLVDHPVVGLVRFRRLIAPGPPVRFNAQANGIQGLQHAVMQVSTDTGAIFQEPTQTAFSRFERGRQFAYARFQLVEVDRFF